MKIEWVKDKEGENWYSKCGEYNIVYYDSIKKYSAYKKDIFINHKTKKKYRAFGNNFVFNQINENKFNTFEDIVNKVQRYVDNLITQGGK